MYAVEDGSVVGSVGDRHTFSYVDRLRKNE